MTQDRLVEVNLDDAGLPAPTPEIEQERRIAVFDLLEANRFAPLPREAMPEGPYRLDLAFRDRQIVFGVRSQSGGQAVEIDLSFSPFAQIVKDYFAICASYVDAVKRLPPAQIEAIDAGRRAIHDEGARLLLERLQDRVDTDLHTARRLFTLICVLHPES